MPPIVNHLIIGIALAAAVVAMSAVVQTIGYTPSLKYSLPPCHKLWSLACLREVQP